MCLVKNVLFRALLLSRFITQQYRATLTSEVKHSLPVSLIYDTPGRKHVRHLILDKWWLVEGWKRRPLDSLLGVPYSMQRVPPSGTLGTTIVKSHASTLESRGSSPKLPQKKIVFTREHTSQGWRGVVLDTTSEGPHSLFVQIETCLSK